MLYVTNPNNLLKMNRFVECARLYATLEALVIVYSIGLFITTQKCFQDLVNASDYPLLVPIFFGWMLFAAKLVYFFPIIVHRFFFRVQRETTKLSNAAKLALCTRGLLNAQKQRIRKTNFVIDIIVMVWMISMLIFRLVADKGCIYWEIAAPNFNVGCCACELITWGFLMVQIGGIFSGLAIKYFIIASYHDYTVHSQKMELKLAEEEAGGQLKSPLARWFRLAEERQVIAIKLGLPFFVLYFVGGGFAYFYAFLGRHVDDSVIRTIVVTITWLVRVFDVFMPLIALAEGGMVLLPWTAYRIHLESRSNAQARARERSLRLRNCAGFRMLSLPRKKVMLALSLFAFVTFGGGITAAHVGLVQFSGYCLVFHAVCGRAPARASVTASLSVCLGTRFAKWTEQS